MHTPYCQKLTPFPYPRITGLLRAVRKETQWIAQWCARIADRVSVCRVEERQGVQARLAQIEHVFGNISFDDNCDYGPRWIFLESCKRFGHTDQTIEKWIESVDKALVPSWPRERTTAMEMDTSER